MLEDLSAMFSFERGSLSPVIEVEGLTKSYGNRVAVNGVHFTIRQGEIFGLLGPNGAGKSTTLSILSTLSAPDAGRVSVCGFDLPQRAPRVRNLIGFVPQDLALYPTLSPRDNLNFFGRLYGLKGAALEKRVESVLSLAGLEDRAKDIVETFSGGMKRRLNIAVGLIHQPRLLLLDEPTVGVDPQSRNFIFEHIEKLKAGGMTIVYSTHYMEEAERLCDRVAIMDNGQIVVENTPKNLIEMLGGGILLAGFPAGVSETLLPLIKSLPNVRAVSLQTDRVKIEPLNSRPALLELIGLCSKQNVSILSLEMLEPNLESVFLHLTGKRLRE